VASDLKNVAMWGQFGHNGQYSDIDWGKQSSFRGVMNGETAPGRRGKLTL
jgi:hypothetical protein